MICVILMSSPRRVEGSLSSTSTIKVNATEKRLVELYRKADSQTKKNAMKLLRGSGAGEIAAGDILSGVLDALTGKRSMPDGAVELETLDTNGEE